MGGVLTSLLLMPGTWIRLGAWLAVGLVICFAYGTTRSRRVMRSSVKQLQR